MSLNLHNPLLKDIKDGDIVVMRSHFGSIEIVKVTNLNFIPAGQKCAEGHSFDFDWLDCDIEMLFVNRRQRADNLKQSKVNMLTACEIIKPDFVDQYARAMGLWKANEHLLTEAEIQVRLAYLERL